MKFRLFEFVRYEAGTISELKFSISHAANGVSINPI